MSDKATPVKTARPLTGVNVLLGASGSVASIRVPRLLSSLHQHGASVRLIVTDNANHFICADEPLPPLDPSFTLYSDKDEWNQWKKLSDPVLHIELRKWAHIFLVAPTSANTLAKLANGICDNLLTSVARAWPFKTPSPKPMVIAPAMNTAMWEHPVTDHHLATLASWGVRIIPPISKTLACGDTGIGAMQDVPKILQFILEITCSQSS